MSQAGSRNSISRTQDAPDHAESFVLSLIRVFVIVLLLVTCRAAMAGEIGANDFYISGVGCRFPDVAYGSRSEKYLVVWPNFGAGRIEGRLVTKDGALSGGSFYISEAGHGALYPAVAYNETDNEFLIVWEQWDRPWGAGCQRVNADTGALIGVNFGAGAGYAAARPAVAWSSISNRYLVTQWSAGEIYAHLITNTGAPYLSDINVSSDPYFSGYPSVTYGTCGGQDLFLVAWDYSPDASGVIAAKTIKANGAMSSRIIVTTEGEEVRSSGAYDEANNRWLVYYTRYSPAPYGSDQYGQFVRPDGSLDGSPLPIAHTAAFEGETVLGCDIAFCPGMNRYEAIYQYYVGEVGGIGSRELYSNGDFVEDNIVLALGGYGSHSNAADPKRSRFLVAFDSLEGNNFWIRGQLWQLDTDVTSNKPNGAYSVGQSIDIEVTFPKKAFVTGTPQLQLETGAVDRRANYASGSGSNTLTFNYVTQAGDVNPDLDYASASAILLNGGTIEDSDGANIDLTLPAPGSPRSLAAHKSIVVNTVSPTVTNVTSDKPDGSYRTGIFSIQVTFNNAVTVTGIPRVEMETGPTDRIASYSGGSGTSTLTFTYQVQSGDVNPDLDYTGITALSLNGGTIKDSALNNADLTLPQPGTPGSLGYNKALVIDAEAPYVRNVSSTTLNGVYKVGTSIDVTVQFHEVVRVTGAPQLELETGSVDRKINYVSGDNTDTLHFAYTVQPGDTSTDLDYKATNSLTLNSGTIKDAMGSNARLTLAAPAAQHSLGYNKTLVIIVQDGRISLAKNQAIGSTVTLGDKVLYLKRTGFGYIEEPDRTAGIRVEGTIDANAGDKVCITGTRQVTPGGEPCILLGLITPDGTASVSPVGACNRNLTAAAIEGLYVAAWGRVMADPADGVFRITDGSDAAGIKVSYEGPAGVASGSYVTIFGAAGSDGARVIYRK